ncbi:type II toxin-antitoxin system VapC family toxin [Mesoterricola silvestris]|uniref:Ribonuclease VapC n=1 Tax=Mesoterricola silvestris TaxID=2927979 RepID=A0AA48KB15_9BACT|nr:type II toxin-antitoxin system VapC family toxin [Mesoterricola silvestris]BDU72068.1 ribonuclease VapC [Mesoterricola silvestris]
MKYILDTDTCIFALKRRPGVLQRLLRESPDDVAVSAMTEAELTFGALKSAAPERALPQVASFLEPLVVLPFDGVAARKHAGIRFAVPSSPIGERDMVTAAIAVASGLVLVTHNTREFARVEGLALEDWAEP